MNLIDTLTQAGLKFEIVKNWWEPSGKDASLASIECVVTADDTRDTVDYRRYVSFWELPNGRQFAYVDLEEVTVEKGIARCRELIRLRPIPRITRRCILPSDIPVAPWHSRSMVSVAGKDRI